MRKRCKNVVPERGLPTITMGEIFFFRMEGKNKLSNFNPIPTTKRRNNNRSPEIIGLIHVPNVRPIVKYDLNALDVFKGIISLFALKTLIVY